jgi:hypothetical protein
MLASSTEESEARDPWVTRMRNLPATVVSTTLEEPLDWPDATLVSGDAVDVVARLKEESEVPLRSHGSLWLNRALMAAGLVDRVQMTLFPVITGQTGEDPIFQGAARLRPRADREPDARRQHPRAHLPAHPPLISSRRKLGLRPGSPWDVRILPQIACADPPCRAAIPFIDGNSSITRAGCTGPADSASDSEELARQPQRTAAALLPSL